jgi:hypothetical protein
MSGKVKRARTPYIYYSQQQRPIVKQAHPEYKFGDIAKHIGVEWKKLDDGQKGPYIEMAEEDKKRRTDELEALDKLNMEEARTQHVYLSQGYESVPCVGLDIGWSKSRCVGPADKLVEYTDDGRKEALKRVRQEGIKFWGEDHWKSDDMPCIGKYRQIRIAGITYQHNLRASARGGRPRYTIGRGGSNSWGMQQGPECKQCDTTFYHDCFGKTWQSENTPSWYAVKK